MQISFANEEELLEYVKANITLVVDKDHGYYGDVSFDAKVCFRGQQIAEDSAFESGNNHCWPCSCYD